MKCFCHIDALIGLQCHSYQYRICAKILKRISVAILWAELAACRQQNFCLPMLRVASLECTILYENLIETKREIWHGGADRSKRHASDLASHEVKLLLGRCSQMQGFTWWRCPHVCLFVCLLPVKFVKWFTMWQHLAANRGFSYSRSGHLL